MCNVAVMVTVVPFDVSVNLYTSSKSSGGSCGAFAYDATSQIYVGATQDSHYFVLGTQDTRSSQLGDRAVPRNRISSSPRHLAQEKETSTFGGSTSCRSPTISSPRIQPRGFHPRIAMWSCGKFYLAPQPSRYVSNLLVLATSLLFSLVLNHLLQTFCKLPLDSKEKQWYHICIPIKKEITMPPRRGPSPGCRDHEVIEKMVGLWLSHQAWQVYRSHVAANYVAAQTSKFRKKYKDNELPSRPEAWLACALEKRFITMADFVQAVGTFFDVRDSIEKEMCQGALYQGWGDEVAGFGFADSPDGVPQKRRHQLCPTCHCQGEPIQFGVPPVRSTWKW